ncbi:MAG: 16S rRNA (adenine(1518)-N(6)/adenine(1519)-N(6))-dimethyltransferase RsmA [Eubacterium sp.]|nr:16S rRNA (adenine(1518)-N(6)/adenine(1519)-N(6))-dimethyltransferase RsmA [Eubacterium sp.]
MPAGYIEYKSWRESVEENLKLSNPKQTIEVIQKHNFSFKKSFGQNFLIDSHVIDKIIRAAEIGPEDNVLEIGPGIGTLTQYLAEAAGKVKAVEIDEKLIPVLSETLAEYDNVEVINQDILKCDIDSLFGGEPFKVVANLPYYITTPIIMGLLEGKSHFDSLTVMIQKEVADRMKAGPGTKDYGALSLAVQYYAEPYLAANVPPNCFMPRPAVGSAVIRLKRRETPAVSVKNERLLFKLIRAAFMERRKTLLNAVKNSQELDIPRERVEEVLTEMGIDTRIRGEALTLEQFALIADRI